MEDDCIFALWFFHNSIRFKVNKDWIREFVRIPSFIFYMSEKKGLVIYLQSEKFSFSKIISQITCK